MSATDRSYYDDDNEKRMERSMRDADKQLAALELSQPMPCILQQFSTADLIAELERRWECITATKVYRDEEFNWSKWGNSKDGAWYQFDSGRVKGTDAYILVISGVE